MRTYCMFVFLLFGMGAMAQAKVPVNYVSKDGKTHIFSATPLENIEATSTKTLCVLNTETGKVTAKIKMETLVFKDKLMQEHFNENYMESEKYPLGVLDAVIQTPVDYGKDGTFDVVLKGFFEIHGVRRERDIPGKLTVKDGKPVRATAVFDVRLEDHKIKIPKAVFMNIAETIKVDVDFLLLPYTKE